MEWSGVEEGYHRRGYHILAPCQGLLSVCLFISSSGCTTVMALRCRLRSESQAVVPSIRSDRSTALHLHSTYSHSAHMEWCIEMTPERSCILLLLVYSGYLLYVRLPCKPQPEGDCRINDTMAGAPSYNYMHASMQLVHRHTCIT